MKTLQELITETSKERDASHKHKVRVIHHPETSGLLDGDIKHIARVKSTGAKKSLITGFRDMDFDFPSEKEGRVGARRLRKAFGKRAMVQFYSFPKDME